MIPWLARESGASSATPRDDLIGRGMMSKTSASASTAAAAVVKRASGTRAVAFAPSKLARSVIVGLNLSY